MAQALQRSPLDARQAEYVQTILASGDGLMSILNDLLDISKIEAGKLELEAIPFELAALAGHACDLWRGAADKKGVRLTRDFGGCEPLWLVGDPTRLRQVMVNLLSNAVKFTTEGEVRLSLRWRAGPEGTAALEITVADTGPGVPNDKRGALFQSFSQADSSITRQFGGTGLGLAICRNLVRLMGGDITLDGDLGHGSVFRVRLALPIAEAASERLDDIELDAVTLDGLRVLVADDNAVNIAVATTLLEAVGMVIGSAANGAEALAALAAEPFDLVLMDVHMPVMDGVEALRRIRAGEAGPADRLVVALTADAMAGVDTGLIDAGFDAVESKPINAAKLIGTIAALVAGGAARAAAPIAPRVWA
jgi:CheY-like chemotaxis protein